MYWFTSNIYFIVFSVLSVALGITFAGCQDNKKTTESLHTNSYYPIHEYFLKEVDSLKKEDKVIFKTISDDKSFEKKDIKIKNWDKELGAFLSIDLNKEVYDNALQTSKKGDTLIYAAKDPEKIDIQQVFIVSDEDGSPTFVKIIRKKKSMLYKNIEEVEYCRSQYYSMNKFQEIIVLGSSQYHIQGEFKN